MTWFIYTILSMISLGVAYTLFKLPSMQGQNRFASTFWVNVFITIITVSISLILSLESLNSINLTFIGLGLFWGMLFSLNMFFQMSALKKMDAGAMFPIASSLSTIL